MEEETVDIQKMLQQDPPVIVGGGSAYVWIKSSMATEVQPEDVPNNVPQPGTPGDYIIYRIDQDPDLGVAVVSKGDGNPAKVHNLTPHRHSTVFQ